MKRQRGRGRKPNGQQNRHFESNGPDIKIRGSASHVFEKYQQLARDAASSGDRIMAENYLQHAEHYFRIVRTQQEAQRERAESQGGQRDQGDGGAQDRHPERNDDAGPQATNGASNPLEVVDPEAADANAQSSGDGEGRPRRARRRTRARNGDGGGDAEARDALDGSSSAATAPSASAPSSGAPSDDTPMDRASSA